MRIFSLTRESLMRHTLALFSLPIVTSNGKVKSVDNPRGNALEYLCGFNYKASTLDMHIRDLKYLQISNLLIETTAKFWIDFWSNRNKSDKRDNKQQNNDDDRKKTNGCIHQWSKPHTNAFIEFLLLEKRISKVIEPVSPFQRVCLPGLCRTCH